MITDEELRARIVDAAAELFTERGYQGTKVGMVARRAGVSAHTVRRLTGGRAQLFGLVMATKVTSTAAQRVAAAASDPSAMPPLVVFMAAAHDLHADPERSWDVLELEALARAHLDPDLQAVETARMTARWENTWELVRQVRAAGGVDASLDDRAVVHHAMALSVGLAMLEPVLDDRPTQAAWDVLMARIGVAMGPDDPEPVTGFTAGTAWRVRVDLPDRPGGLARLTRALGALHVYTVAVYVVGARQGYRTVDLALTAPASVASEQIVAAAGSAGCNPYVSPGDPDDALDLPTRVIDGATQLVTTPGWAPIGARILAQADSVEVVPAATGADAGPHVLRLQWTATRHVVLRRSWAPFARAERTRASALLRLSAAIAAATGDEDALGWMEGIRGGTVWIRFAHPIDADAVAAMHERCSQRTRYLRYVSLTDWRDDQLRRLSGGHRGATLVALDAAGDVIALGNVFPESAADQRAAEVALLVEDAHQGRGLGRVLLAHLVRLARDLGFTEVVAVVLAENAGMQHLLAGTGLAWTRRIEAGMATWRASLDPSDRTDSEVRPAEKGP